MNKNHVLFYIYNLFPHIENKFLNSNIYYRMKKHEKLTYKSNKIYAKFAG